MEETKAPLVYSCSGCSNVAQGANRLAVRLDREGLAEMSCIAGVGAGVFPIVRIAKSGRPILAIDGCPSPAASRPSNARTSRQPSILSYPGSVSRNASTRTSVSLSSTSCGGTRSLLRYGDSLNPHDARSCHIPLTRDRLLRPRTSVPAAQHHWSLQPPMHLLHPPPLNAPATVPRELPWDDLCWMVRTAAEELGITSASQGASHPPAWPCPVDQDSRR